MPTLSIINQLHTAVRNPAALLLGGACGALVPLGTSYVTHELLAGELAQWSILPGNVGSSQAELTNIFPGRSHPWM